jgi:CheY-like chemotaxis protein
MARMLTVDDHGETRRMKENEPNLFKTPRRAPRYYFGGAAELTDETGQMSIAMVRTLSLYGCFVKANKRININDKIALRITNAGSQFSAKARIANQANDGFGVEFTKINANDKAQLESWLSELAKLGEVSKTERPGGVLIVDDHNVTRSTIRSMLHDHSFHVCGEAGDGRLALERVKQLRPDVVLLDIDMPVMNGIQAAYEIRRISPSTKILFFTVHTNEATSSVRVLGADGVVTKSAAATELIPALRRLVQADTLR